MFEPLLLFCFLLLIPLLFIFITPKSPPKSLPKSYPIIGNYLSIYTNRHRFVQYTSDGVHNSPTSTFIIHSKFNQTRIITGNPTVIQHILKSRFSNYQKGDTFRKTLSDLLGNGIFNVDGNEWKFQRQVSSHEFNTKSLRHFVEDVVDKELNERLIPVLTSFAVANTVVDMQDVLQRFAFDNICRIAFGYDPEYLTPLLQEEKFASAFEDAVRISSERFRTFTPLVWKLKRVLNIGSEKRLKQAVSEIREFASKILIEKKQELENKSSIRSVDLLSRFISSGHSDEKFVTDIVISFILAGRDTTSAALTWFFWLVSKDPAVESKILREVDEKSDSPVYDEVKEMVYTHASLCESMRLYPPVPMDTKEAGADDVLRDGTVVKKGMMVSYHPHAMGRMEKLWGGDWMEFRPERWLETDEKTGDVRFMARDPYTYPVFQAGLRICLGKDMAFLQMKRVVAGVLRQFKVVPVAEDRGEPIFVAALTSKMKGGFPVKILERK